MKNEKVKHKKIKDIERKLKERTVDYKDYLYERLKDPEARIAYLNAAIGEETSVFLIALRDIIDATENISSISKKTNLNRQNLYKMLSGKTNPQINNITKVLQSLGLQLSVQAYR